MAVVQKPQKKKRAAPHPLFGDFIVSLLIAWDEVKLAAIMATTRECLASLPVSKNECAADFAQYATWPVPRGREIAAMPVLDAADYFATELRAVHAQLCAEAEQRARGPPTRLPVSAAWVTLLKDAARAFFLAVFFFDGRIRRLVCAPHRVHDTVWQTVPPRPKRLRQFFDQGALDLAKHFVSDMAAVVDRAHRETPLTRAEHETLFEYGNALNATFVKHVRDWYVTLTRTSLWATPIVAPPPAWQAQHTPHVESKE